MGLIQMLPNWTNIFPCRLDVMSLSVCVTRINLGLMINASMRLASSRRLIFGWPVIALGLTGKFVRFQVRANETYSEAKRQFSDRNSDVLMNVQSPYMWWSTLKSAVFGSSSSLPSLVSEGGGLVCESVGKAICWRIILTASSPGRLLIYGSLIIHLLVLPPLRLGRVRWDVFC